MSRLLITAAVLAAATGAAPAAQRTDAGTAKLERLLAGRTPGPAQNCINPGPREGGQRYGQIVVMKDRAGTLYTNDLGPACSIPENYAMIDRRFQTQLCRGDMIEFRDLVSGIPRGSCSYGDFTPYRRPKDAR